MQAPFILARRPEWSASRGPRILISRLTDQPFLNCASALGTLSGSAPLRDDETLIGLAPFCSLEGDLRYFFAIDIPSQNQSLFCHPLEIAERATADIDFERAVSAQRNYRMGGVP